MNLIHKLEPIWWILFGAGGFVAAFFLPGVLIGVTVLAPLTGADGFLPYERALALATSPVGRVFLIALLSLTFWHSAHHLRHFAIDIGGAGMASIGAWASYLVALIGTIASVIVVGGLGA